jgi:hypothetical protein
MDRRQLHGMPARLSLTKLVNAIGLNGFKATEVLLDNQANISIMRQELLRAFEHVETEIRVNGVGGVQVRTNETGYLQDFFRVYTSPDTKANVLSFADVEDMYPITYEPQESFTVHLPDRDIVFSRRDKLHIADFDVERTVAVTRAYTKAEEARAKAAYEIIRNCGYPSQAEAIHLMQDGNFTHMPMVTAEDVKRAYELYGEPVGSTRGKLVRQKQSRAIYDDDLIMDEKKQVLHADVMHLDGQHFLVTVCEPLQLVMQCPIERETALVLRNTLQDQIELLRSRGFTPIRVHTDPQSAFRSLSTKFENVVIDTGGGE